MMNTAVFTVSQGGRKVMLIEDLRLTLFEKTLSDMGTLSRFVAESHVYTSLFDTWKSS